MSVELQKNKKILIIIIPAFILLAIVGIAKIMGAKNNNSVEVKKKTESFVDPDLDYSTDTIKNKKKVYDVSDEKTVSRENDKKNSRVSIEDLGDMAGKDPKKEDGIGFESNHKEEPKKVTTVPKVVYITRKEKKPAQVSTVAVQMAPAPKEEYYPTMSISQSANSKNETNSSKTNGLKSDDENYFPAILEEGTTVRDNTNLIFILYKDAIIQGTVFKKNSVIYTTAIGGSTGFDVKAYTIKNAADNKKYQVNLILFNENLSRGIKYEGNLNNAAKQGKRDALDEGTSLVQSSNVALGLGASAVRGTVRALDRQPEVSLRQGYRVNFKILEER